MANCLICYPNHADSGTLTGEGWTDALPVTNLQTRFLGQVARTEGTDLFSPAVAIPGGDQCSAVIHVDFGRPRYLSALALCNHNLTRRAQARVVLWTDSARTTVRQDFGWQPVWPRWFDTVQLRWADDNFLYGQVSDEQIGHVKRIYLLMLSSNGFASRAISIQYASIYLSDADNAEGYIEAGRLYMAEDWSPKHNMIYGASLSWVDPSIVDSALDGTKWFEERTKNRIAVFQLKYMRPLEGVNKALLLTQLAGITKDVLFIFDPADAQLMQQRSFVGRLSELSPLEWWMFRLTSMAFKIEETV